MLFSEECERYRHVQCIARAVLEKLPENITAESTEASIAQNARELLVEHGVVDAWYYGVHALVLLGSRSCLSESGRTYHPASEPVGSQNLITVDLSPEIDGVWGDCARSYIVENGQVVMEPTERAFSAGVDIVMHLHREMRRFTTPATTLHDLYEFGNERIFQHGCENLDFRRNLGHSIVREMKDRHFIEQGNCTRLGDVKLFTFEPHVRASGAHWGFKHENIYYFDRAGTLQEL